VAHNAPHSNAPLRSGIANRQLVRPDKEDGRNLWFQNKPVSVTKGETTAHIRIDIGGGVIITSSITNEAVDDLALEVGTTP
jgi:molybdopterin-binding protein